MVETSETLKTLDQVIKDLPSPQDLPVALPLTHLTTAKKFESLVGKGKLEPQSCGVFGDEILYFFYGGVFYRSQNKSTQDKLELPIAFVFNPSALEKINCYYPFDTGAMAKNKFGKKWGNRFNSSKETFKVYGNRGYQVPRRLIYHIFGSNEFYLKGILDSRCDSKPDPLPEVYEFMSTDFSHLKTDLRQCAIECQSLVTIDLGRDLEWVGIPESQTDLFLELCKKTSPHIPNLYIYQSHRIFNPSETGAILEEFAKKDYINRFIDLP
ncbi:MAG: hypothetical protein FD167_261 [bacterium]|nr:MAG: hypothetical protein FD167_261 [bacterium]